MRKVLFCMVIAMLAVSLLCLPLFSATDAPASSYILGDVDGDGDISISDVTIIQRMLAHLIQDPDGGYTLRGDVDGDGEISISDATFIQRYLAHLKTEYPIGELIEAPTEPATEAPTEALTEAPTEAPTAKATIAPTEAPTEAPTQAPTVAPTVKPTTKPDPYELPPI